MNSKKRAMIAMSGGVDSGVAAYMTKKSGFSCIGITMKLYNNEDIGAGAEKTCCTLEDVQDARSVAYKIGIPHYVFNFTEKFEEMVIRRFVNTYIEGGTPNPCIDCNRYLKFQKLLQRMQELQYDYVVTGHYARIQYDSTSGRYLLKKALDASKDQSYVLYSLTQEQLAHTRFPLGDFTKAEIRKIAAEQGFVNAKKRDSQDICFVPDGDYGSFIEHFCGHSFPEGKILLEDGRTAGVHKGLIRYTIGQRKGLGLSLGKPVYVLGKNLEKNQLIVGDSRSLYRDTLMAEDVNLIIADRLDHPIRCRAKIRYQHPEAWATAVQKGDRLYVKFDEPQRGITKGQAVVLYDGDIVIGGGTIIE